MAPPPSQVDEVADRYVDDYATLDPCGATFMGVTGHDDRLTDYSPEGFEARAELTRRALADVDRISVSTDHDRVARAVMAERGGLDVEIHDAGYRIGDLNVIASPLQDIRMVFDLMDTDSPESWATVATRMAAVPEALAGYRRSLQEASRARTGPARRQVAKCAEQCATWAGREGGAGFFWALVERSGTDGPARADLERAAEVGDAAFGDFGRFLLDELAPAAHEHDAVGRDRYSLWSRYFTGARLDLDETYAWGWQELARIEAEMAAVAERIAPGGSVADAVKALEEDEARRVHTRDALQSWLQDLSDRTLAELDGVHFDIPEPVRTLECRIAPPGGGAGMYYTGPAEDWSRPGRMWWSLPEGLDSFTTWREVTTVFHEGVPGHHLQVAQAVYRADTLNRFQRLMCWVSGHGEGWALYAERLMAELGHLDDPGDRLGMLDAQAFRAARVVIDIGMHLELEIPAGAGFHEGERWTPELGLDFLRAHTNMEDAFVRDELDRYLGWPGQAPSYKVGERVWLAAREDARRRHGDSFDLKAFHAAALDLGSMGLDPLHQELARI